MMSHPTSPAAIAREQVDWRWIAALYVLAWIPVGPVWVMVGSSVAYYRLRQARPLAAARINRHAFIALGLVLLFILARRALRF